MFQSFIYSSLVFIGLTSAAHAKPLALIYEGPGSCAVGDGDCTGAAEVATLQAGYDVKRVGPNALVAGSTEADYRLLFQKAAVWVQPGGGSKSFLKALSPELKVALRRFIFNGGGYVGFCAGAFSTTTIDGTLLDVQGLGIFPGKTHPYPNQILDSFSDYVTTSFNNDAYNNHIFEVNWNGKVHHLYFEEGPSINLSGASDKTVEVVGTFRNGQVVSARTTYGRGRVFITGAHPEAPMSWRTKPDLIDVDGLDYDLVAEMLNWSRKGSVEAYHPNNLANPNQAASPAIEPGVFLGLNATYNTVLQAQGTQSQTQFAKTTLTVVAYDASTHNYGIEILSELASGKKTYKLVQMEETELNDHQNLSFLNHCEDYEGQIDTSRNICKFSSSSIDFYIGKSPFSIVGTTSVDGAGNHYVTEQVL